MQYEPRDLPRVREDMCQVMETAEWKKIWANALFTHGFGNHDGETWRQMPKQEAQWRASSIYQSVLSRWKHGDLYYVTGAMCDLAFMAAETLPDFEVHETDLPSDSGICYFEKPVGVATFSEGSNDKLRDARLPIHFATWGKLPQSFMDPRARTFPVSLHWMTPRKVASAIAGNSEWEQQEVVRILGPLIEDRESLLFVRPEGFNEPLSKENVEEIIGYQSGRDTHPGKWSLRLQTTWLMMNQQIATVDDLPLDRPQRRRAARAGYQLNATRVITLRHRSHSSSHSESDREYHHRWMVKGHWRNQWYPSQQRHIPIWINPHIKGPDDAPLLTGEKVYAWTR